MALFDLLLDPVKAPIRRSVTNYRVHFEEMLHSVKNEIVDRLDSSEESTKVLRKSIAASQSGVADQLAVAAASSRALEADVEALRNELTTVREDMAAMRAESSRLGNLTGARLAEIDGEAAAFLNWTSAWNGPLSDAGLFINHPYLVEWRHGGASVRLVNERIIEQPFVFAAISDLRIGSRILDVGGGESTLGLALASLGHEVTVIEPRGYPFEHPNLTVYEGPLETFEPDEPFDAVILLSTIEHLGIGHYADGTSENASADLAAMKIVREITAPGGRLVLTTPYGPSAVTELERIYDRDDLKVLLDGWQILRLSVGREVDETTWTVEGDGLADHRGDKCVAMVVGVVPSPGPPPLPDRAGEAETGASPDPETEAEAAAETATSPSPPQPPSA